MNSIHDAFTPLHNPDATRGHIFLTEGRPIFPATIDPPVFPYWRGVKDGIFGQGTRAKQFSGVIIFSLEKWEKKSSATGFEVECHWRRQVYPRDTEILYALETDTLDGTIWEQLKRAIGMLKRVPLVRGCAIVIKFGHRGDEHPPIIEIVPDFLFGYDVVQEEVVQQIRRHRAHEAKLGIQLWRGVQSLWGGVGPVCPAPITQLPDLWEDSDDIRIVSDRLELVMGQFLRRLETRKKIIELMAKAHIKPAPGDRHTVVVLGDDAELRITRRIIQRAGGVTRLDPEAQDDPLPIEPDSDRFKFRPTSGTPELRPQRRPQIGRRLIPWAPPPPSIEIEDDE